jgi:3-isopropylmalate dehydrogenase
MAWDPVVQNPSMMLENLGEQEASAAIEEAVKYTTAKKLKSMNAGRMGYSTSQVGDMVAQYVAEE